MPRLICVAADFTKYDEYAVKQINRNIDLVRYKRFGKELLMLDLINSNVVNTIKDAVDQQLTKQSTYKTFVEQLQSTSEKLRRLLPH
ncbi:hypothetical protein [Clostridium sp. C8-1-8]|uniref:hypothetical protein n=1 Tax=Clostridium sp. C8-1-8 TaxID=2698831 RepID=UPI00192107CC|nr:hypothetical protein [Clostridium sp. C8-1-8]